MGHGDQLWWCSDASKGNCGREHIACNRHGAQFLSPTIDNSIGHRSSMLIDNHSIVQRTWKLHNCLYFGSTRTWCWIEDNNRHWLISNIGCREGRLSSGCRDELLHSKMKHALAYLLALCEAYTIFAVYLIDTAPTDTVVSMVL